MFGDWFESHCVASQAGPLETMPQVTLERPANGGLLSIRDRSLSATTAELTSSYRMSAHSTGAFSHLMSEMVNHYPNAMSVGLLPTPNSDIDRCRWHVSKLPEQTFSEKADFTPRSVFQSSGGQTLRDSGKAAGESGICGLWVALDRR